MTCLAVQSGRLGSINVSIPGFGVSITMAVVVATNNIGQWRYSAHYEKLALNLEGYGVPIVVANVSRIDCLMNAAGLVDTNY